MMQQQPIQPAIAEPAFMPPQLPQSLQPQGFNAGGPVIVGAGSKFPRIVEDTESADSSSIDVLGDVDIGQPAGTVVLPPKVDAIGVDAFVERIGTKLDTASPEEVGDDIVKNAVEEPTGDLRFDLATLYKQMTGDATAYEKNIDALNRGIIGAAIGAGTSARATENISKGLLVGLEGARNTEERRAGDARALQLAALQGLVKGSGAGGGGTEMSPQETYIDSIREAANIIMQTGLAGSYEEAMTMAEQQLRPKFEEAGFLAPTAPAPPSGGAAPEEQEAVLAEARLAIEQGRDPAVISDRLRQMGIDPGLL
jgi:hypothetical protein